MAKVSRLKIVKDLIDEGRLQTLVQVFDYATKAEVAKGVGMNYTRLLRLIKDPLLMTYADGRAIAKVLRVTHRQISNLVHNQLEEKKK